MFLETSRYHNLSTADAVARDGRTVKVLKLRRPPAASGTPSVVKGNDRLDIMAHRKYSNGTLFWHIADANTELQANDLVKEAGRVIDVPEP